MQTIDLNADLGETEGDYLALLPLISSANVACGAHAGGGQLLVKTIEAAKLAGVKVGAHPSYPDSENFGRLSMRGEITNEALLESIVSQIDLVSRELLNQGEVLHHVKAHGALYNDAMIHQDMAEVLVAACSSFSKAVPLLGQPGSVLESVAKAKEVPFISEGFMDRAYNDNGTLVSRSLPGSVLDHQTAKNQILQLVTTGNLTTYQGNQLPLEIQTLCVHADTPDAVATVQAVREILEAHHIRIAAY
jgi:UPF0271 protein